MTTDINDSKNDLVIFYSHHSNKIKCGITMVFYLRALEICSIQYLHKKIRVYTLFGTGDISFNNCQPAYIFMWSKPYQFLVSPFLIHKESRKIIIKFEGAKKPDNK